MPLDLNNITPYFLVYVALFRLAIITAGIVSIVLGYQLFCKGIFPGTGNQDTTLEADMAGTKFTFKNAAPGTFFALFGVTLIGLMLFKGAPEFTYKMMAEGNQNTASGTTSTIGIKMRGEDTKDTFETLLQKCLDLHGKGESDQAIEICHQALTQSTQAMYYLATIYQDQGKITEAFGFAKTAVILNPHETDYLKTLADILCQAQSQNGNTLHWMEPAVKQEPNYEMFGKQLDKFKQIRCKSNE